VSENRRWCRAFGRWPRRNGFANGQRPMTNDEVRRRSYNRLMLRWVCLLALCLSLRLWCAAQSQPGERDANQNQAPPRSERSKEAGESSSRDTRIDLSPPANDAKEHPHSTIPEDEGGDKSSADVQEFHPFDPHRAAKDLEVGDFYFKKKNYGAALERYREALFYKPNDALANFRMAQAFDKLARVDEAIEHYEVYLKILPTGPQSEEAKKAIEKLRVISEKNQAQQ
jgi:tetratricopeptide (TPR) repeat protein